MAAASPPPPAFRDGTHLATALATNRALFAFVLDCGLYAVWQAVLLRGRGAGFRFVPFFGLAAWLVVGGGEGGDGGEGVGEA